MKEGQTPTCPPKPKAKAEARRAKPEGSPLLFSA
jgi:hypothetical protein